MNNSSVLVSVIIPVFNAPEQMVKGCLASVCAQTHEYIEVLICDDGSEEGCALSLDIATAGDMRCSVLHLQHGGVSAARNAGIDASHGEWIAFVDVDDEVSPFFIEDALDIAQDYDADYVGGDVDRVYANDHPTSWDAYACCGQCDKPIVVSGDNVDDFRSAMLSYHDLSNGRAPSIPQRGPVSKLYRSSVVGNTRFSIHVSHGEDVLFNYQVLAACKRIVQCRKKWYRINMRMHSSSHRFMLKERLGSAQVVLHATLDSPYSNSGNAFACCLAIQGAEAALLSEASVKQKIRDAVSSLREFTRTGCFKSLDPSQFVCSLPERFIYCLCRTGLFRLSVAVLIVKAYVKKVLLDRALLQDESGKDGLMPNARKSR